MGRGGKTHPACAKCCLRCTRAPRRSSRVHNSAGACKVQPGPRLTSGAMYSGVPHVDLETDWPASSFEKPKSQILSTGDGHDPCSIMLSSCRKSNYGANSARCLSTIAHRTGAHAVHARPEIRSISSTFMKMLIFRVASHAMKALVTFAPSHRDWRCQGGGSSPAQQ